MRYGLAMTTPSDDLATRVGARLRDIPDFPKQGILFKDITPVLTDPALFGEVIGWMSQGWDQVDRLVAMESRGFLFAAPMVQRMNAGMALARKKGKLPYATEAVDYALEYGTATLEMHVDAIAPGQRVLVVDDLLATGGTAEAAIRLIHELGGEVAG
ncbi:MAG: adenine phosphoribosyltransferase, partial [Myxococcales bacterium]|nr:adenine phosphoribosyltransferase [Myxococcales bacterium]